MIVRYNNNIGRKEGERDLPWRELSSRGSNDDWKSGALLDSRYLPQHREGEKTSAFLYVFVVNKLD